MLQKDIDCARQEKKIWKDTEERLLGELNRVKNNLKEDLELKYNELQDFQNSKEEEVGDLRQQLK